MRYAATKPGTSDLYNALVADNTERLKRLLKNIGLSNSGFAYIKSSHISSFQQNMAMISRLNESGNEHKATLKVFFDFVASAVDKRLFLRRIGEMISQNEAKQRLPEEIRIVLRESDWDREISEQIEGLSRGQLVTLILFFTSRKGSSFAIIDYKRFRAIIEAIRNTNLIPHCQLCNLMLGNILT